MKIQTWFEIFLNSLIDTGLNMSDPNSLSRLRILGTENDGNDAIALSSANISKRQMKKIYKLAKEGRLYVQSENAPKERRFLEVADTDSCSFANPQPRERTEASRLLDKAAYMNTLNKLFKDVTDTDFFLSFDSRAYKNARASILAVQKTLTNTPAESFTLDLVQDKMESITMLAKQYMKTHETNRSSRQELRYNAFSQLAKFNDFVNQYHNDTAEFDNPPKETAPKEEAKEETKKTEKTEMEQCIGLIENHKGWIGSEKIPMKLQCGGTIRELEDYKKTANPIGKDSEFIDMRIASEKFFTKFLEEKVAPVTTKVEIKEDGSFKLPEIKQDEFQSSKNGCYSCAMKLLMQGQGVNISQKLIRAYRGDQTKNNDNTRALGDNMGSAFELGGLLVSKLKNTAVCEACFTGLDKNASLEMRAAAKKAMIELVTKAIKQYHSPVAVMSGSHYQTIVGYDKEKDSFIIKDSKNPAPGSTLPEDPNKDHHIPVDQLTNMRKLHFTYAFPIDPKDPTKELTGCDDVEFVNGRFLHTNVGTVGLVDNCDYPDSRLMIGGIPVCEGVGISVNYKVPMKMEIPEDMIVPGVNDCTIKPAKDDPQKQELLSKIDKEIRSIFPTGNKVTVTPGTTLTSIKFLQNTSKEKEDDFIDMPNRVSPRDFARYIYLRQIKDNMDKYTPLQAKRALIQKNRNFSEERIYDNGALIDLISAYQPQPGKKPFTATPDEMYSAFNGYVQFHKEYSTLKKMNNQELNTYLEGIEENIKNSPEKKYRVLKHEVKKLLKQHEEKLPENKKTTLPENAKTSQVDQPAPEKK